MKLSFATAAGRSIRAIIFDYGEVIAHAPDRASIASMATVLNVTPDRFRDHYDAHRYAYDRGDLTGDQYWLAVSQDAGIHLSSEQIASLRDTDVAMWSNVNPLMLRWAGELRAAGLRTSILSNMHLDMVAAVRSGFHWLSEFECVVLSAEMRIAKPAPEIFTRCLECLQVRPEEAMFIDDRERNVRAAEAVGLLGILANSPATIRQRLEEIGWNAPLPQ